MYERKSNPCEIQEAGYFGESLAKLMEIYRVRLGLKPRQAEARAHELMLGAGKFFSGGEQPKTLAEVSRFFTDYLEAMRPLVIATGLKRGARLQQA